MFAVRTIALICLISASQAAILEPVEESCENVPRPLAQLDLSQYEGTWALVADSMKVVQAAGPVERSDSVSIVFTGSAFRKSNRDGQTCSHLTRNNSEIQIDGSHYSIAGPTVQLSGTVYHPVCQDCVMLSFKMDSPGFKLEELCLFSKRRAVTQEELNKFASVVKCLDMPQHVVLDPTKELCDAPVH